MRLCLGLMLLVGACSLNLTPKTQHEDDDRPDAAVHGDPDAAVLHDCASDAPRSCLAILEAGASHGDGVYTIAGGVQVQCLMTVDGGGWTQIGNFPYQGTTAGVAGWTSGAQVGTSFTDNSVPWKMSDALINAIKTIEYRAHGTASDCLQGPCTVDTTLYWKGTCTYRSDGLGSTCGTAYMDVGMTTRPPLDPSDSTACTWHYGLVSSICGTTSELGTSHLGDHEFVGVPGTYIHAYDGRGGEDPSIQMWAR